MKPPYYAVVFTSQLSDDSSGYAQMADKMMQLAKNQPGFIAVETARESIGITVSYWESLEAITNWKKQTDHLLAQKLGSEKWYANYTVRICKVEREYSKNRTGLC